MHVLSENVIFFVKFGATELQSWTFLARIWASVGLRGLRQNTHILAISHHLPEPLPPKSSFGDTSINPLRPTLAQMRAKNIQL